MKTVLRVLVALVVIVVAAGGIIYADGASLPVDHSVSVTGTVPAPPDQVFARIADVGRGAAWRPEVKGVTLLAPVAGRTQWSEDIGHGQSMTFLAVRSQAPAAPAMTGLREVQLDDPAATYGGTWLYEIGPGPTPGTTTLRITETGFIHPPVYRFMMHHIFGMTHNLDAYMKDLDASFKS